MGAYHNLVEIVIEDQAIKWMVDLIETVVEWRAQVDGAEDVVLQKRYHDKLRLNYGIALGALKALGHCRKISPVGYDKMTHELMFAMRPKVVEVRGGILA